MMNCFRRYTGYRNSTKNSQILATAETIPGATETMAKITQTKPGTSEPKPGKTETVVATVETVAGIRRVSRHIGYGWDEQLEHLEDSSLAKDKFTTIYFLKHKFEICDDIIAKELDGISKKNKDGKEEFSSENDMVMIRYIRMLYCLDGTELGQTPAGFKDKYLKLQQDIKSHLGMYPFWPPLEKFKNKDISQIQFWSENHLIMHLSCAYLYYQFLAIEKNDNTLQFEIENKECQYLKIWFELHFHQLMGQGPGIYEVFSHVYLCFTLCALMNIYDYCRNPDLKAKAEVMIDRIVYLLVLGLEPKSGISTFTGEFF
jgi:hypothetical protein